MTDTVGRPERDARRGVAQRAGKLPSATTPATESVGTPGAGRDRVLDAVKAFALAVVVLAHSIAWDVSMGEPRSVLDARPGISWVTWTAQILPLFFAVGAVANLGSWRRRPYTSDFLRRRLIRLGAPALVYASFWTLLLLPAAPFIPDAEVAGRFLSMLLWFLGTYAAVVVAVPWTSRWASRPVLTLSIWLAVIIAVDVVRLEVEPAVGWLNMLLVWGWLHQLGYHLPALRTWPRIRLLAVAPLPLALALLVAVPGPFSSSLVSIAGDPEPSNLSPPTVVVALYGLTQVLVLAAVYPWLTHILRSERAWRAVGYPATRAIGVYLWHIPWVAIVGATAWLAGFPAAPFDALWWLAHAAGLAVILTMAWLTAGLASRAERAIIGWGEARQRHVLPALPFAVTVPVALLAVTITGFGTWWDQVFLGIPTSSLLNLALLTVALGALAVGRDRDNRTARARDRKGA